MSEHSDRYNSLPFEDRKMLNGLMIEAEIRFIELEKKTHVGRLPQER